MLRYHMALITRDSALRRSVKRLTTATGSTADFLADAGQIEPAYPVDLVIYDARHQPPDTTTVMRMPQAARIVYLIEGDSLADRIELLMDPRATSLFCHDDRFDDDEFISTSTKALRGDVFGLAKYFPWGVTLFSMVVRSYQEKTKALEILLQYATLAGCRGGVRDRIQLVGDELMMNALYHSAVDETGREIHAGKSVKELTQLDEVNPIQVQYGCSGRYFGFSVRDGGGSLPRDRILDYLVRAAEHTPMEEKAGGAGLGLLSVLRSVSKLVFNLAPNQSTEVIGLFDMELLAKGKMGARSLHIFHAAPEVAAAVPAPVRLKRRGMIERSLERVSAAGIWTLAAFLLVVALGLLVVFYVRR